MSRRVFLRSILVTSVGTTLSADVHAQAQAERRRHGWIIPTNKPNRFNLKVMAFNPIPAPECLALDPDDIIAPGASYTDEEDEEGTELYQCCIHPWMRAVVTARE